MYRTGVFVRHLLRVELARLPLNKIHSELYSIGFGLRIKLIEKALSLAEFVSVTEDHQYESLLVRGDADQSDQFAFQLASETRRRSQSARGPNSARCARLRS
jgi:hypothetical protein